MAEVHLDLYREDCSAIGTGAGRVGDGISNGHAIAIILAAASLSVPCLVAADDTSAIGIGIPESAWRLGMDTRKNARTTRLCSWYLRDT
jgi:ApbE superfamily uncharacterized protein (UPF0280 family)